MKTIFALLLACACFAENTTIILVSPPRSLSVGFLRMMQARGDFEIFHEPTVAPYDAVHYQDFYEQNFRKDAFQSYDEVTNAIAVAADRSNVFVKEMAFCFHEYLRPDSPFLQKAHFVFLVRKPQDTIISMYKKDKVVRKELIGYRKTYELFRLVAKYGIHPPVVIFSEDLGERPYETVSYFCDKMKIPFMPEALAWDDLGAEFAGQTEWNEGKKPEFVQHWHGDAIHSTCFVPLRTAEVDGEGVPTFSEIENPEDRELCREAYFYNLPYYLLLKDHLSVNRMSR